MKILTKVTALLVLGTALFSGITGCSEEAADNSALMAVMAIDSQNKQEAARKDATVESIAITTQPAKTTYCVGESFDSTGMAVTATYQSGRTAVVTDYTTDFTTQVASAGSKTVTVTCGEKTATFKVAVMLADFKLIPAGSFSMGCTANDSDEEPVHTVTISKPFYMCDHEVTQKEYQAVMGTNPSWFKSDAASEEVQENRPVEQVSWYMALVYCNKLSIKEGFKPCYTINNSTDPSDWGTIPTSDNSTWNAVNCSWTANGYRLPTEAEWEYAARAGNNTTDSVIYSGTTSESSLGTYAWYKSNSNSKTHEVKKKAKNSFDLYDMSGNVWEWCWDWFGSYSSSSQTDPKGAESGYSRVRRGGNWFFNASKCAVSYRNYSIPCGKDNGFGFRVVRPSSN